MDKTYKFLLGFFTTFAQTVVETEQELQRRIKEFQEKYNVEDINRETVMEFMSREGISAEEKTEFTNDLADLVWMMSFINGYNSIIESMPNVLEQFTDKTFVIFEQAAKDLVEKLNPTEGSKESTETAEA